MKLYEKILIFIEVVITIIYSIVEVSGYKVVSDGIGSLFGSLLFLFLISYFIAFLLAKFSKSENRKLALWKMFIKIYPVILTLVVIGKMNQ
jgi:hypothetical protein